MEAQTRLSRLVEWATAHGASLHPSVEVYDDPQTGFSFRVKQVSAGSDDPSLPAWDRVVSLPSSLALSYLDAVRPIAHEDGGAPISPFQSGVFVEKTPPHVVGRFFLVWQYLLREDSFWWPYIQALPQPDDDDEDGDGGSWRLAPFWRADDAELLEGTNVEVGMERIKREVRNEYSRAIELFLSGSGEGVDPRVRAVTLRLYQWAYCIYSSRSFRPSLVMSHGEGGGPESGARLPPGVGMDDFSVLLPLFDIGNHDMTLDVKWDVVRGADGDAASPTQSSCELRVGRAFKAGEQVFNNYSLKTNAELLLGYGFMIPPTADLHNDYIHVRKRAASSSPAHAGSSHPPEEYYISLRPMVHHSSLLGRRRQGFAVEEKTDTTSGVLGAFQHLQTDMVWDIFTTLVAGQGHDLQTIFPLLSGEEEIMRRQRFFRGDVPDTCRVYVEQTAAVIQNKVLQELERLDETDVEVAEGDEEALTRNQKLALTYRQRCREVLENTLEAIEGMMSDES